MLFATDVQASKVPPVSPWSTATTPEHLCDTSSLTSHFTSSPLHSKSSVCSPSEALRLLAAGPSTTVLSPWSMATTPEHLWDTSSRTPLSTRSSPLRASLAPHALRSSPSEAQELSSLASSPSMSQIAAIMTVTPTSSAQRLVATSASPAADSPTFKGQADASAGRHSSVVQRSLDAGPHGAMFSGSPVGGLCRTGPQFPVRMTKKQKVSCWPQSSRDCERLLSLLSSLHQSIFSKQQKVAQTSKCPILSCQ